MQNQIGLEISQKNERIYGLEKSDIYEIILKQIDTVQGSSSFSKEAAILLGLLPEHIKTEYEKGKNGKKVFLTF
jgi:hypothetical protein